MKRTVIILILVSCLYPPRAFSESPGVVRLVAGPYSPFTGEGLQDKGIASKIVSDAFKNEGLQTEIVIRPWKRAFVETKKGKFHGSLLWRKTTDRQSFFYYSDPVVEVQVVFFHLKSKKFNWNKLNDLAGLKIGAVNSFNYDDEFDAAMKSGLLMADYVTTQEQNFRKLLNGRIDITPVVKRSGYATIKEMFTPNEIALITSHPLPLANQELHLVLSKKLPENKKILKSFNRGLKKLKDSGKI